jgi:hypothetical protein
MDFAQMMKNVEQTMNERFNNTVKDLTTVTRKNYLVIFLGHFLGFDSTHDMSGTDDSAFDNNLHGFIDSVSLCEPEIIFFHACVNLKKSDDFISGYIKLYNETDNLKNCQLGNQILTNLESSKKLTITN